MEPRAAAAEYDKGTGNYTLWSTSQNPHVLRLILSAFVLGIPEHKLRVIAPDVGGGFGSKIFCYNEETMVTWAASPRRPADQVDRRAQRIVPDRRAWPRPRHPCRAGARQGRQVPGAEGRDHRQHGRLSVDLLDGGADLSLRHAAGRPVHDAADLRQREGGADAHRAGRRLSRRRPSRGDLRHREHRQQGGQGTEDRSGRAAPEELHSVDRLPVPDAGGAAVQFGQLPADHRRGDQDRRLQGLRGPPRRGQVARQAARHRLLVLYRGLRAGAVTGHRPAGRRCRPVGIGAAQVQPDGQRPDPDRRAQPRPGPRDDLRPARVGQARRADRADRGRPRRHGDDAVRHGQLRQPLAGRRRLGHHEGGRQGHRQGQEDRGPPDGGVGGRRRLRAGHLQGRRHRQGRAAGPGGVRGLCAAQLSAGRARARHGRERLLRSVELRLSGGHADLRGRDRSRHRRCRESSATRRSTISATSSIR